MARIRARDTAPELVVRQALHSLGYRYRLHGRGLPGRPDIVFAGRRMVIFVHGCFWHHHEGCAVGRVPRTRPDYWRTKFEGNRARDRRNVTDLEAAGWTALVVWECELGDRAALTVRLVEFLGERRRA